jgi:hypothetical protein
MAPEKFSLMASIPGDAMLSASGVTVTHNANHTIHGRGDISMTATNTVFVNNGTINSDTSGSPGGTLRISLSNGLGNRNNGTFTATNGGVLSFVQGFLDQSGGGIITAADGKSTITLGDATHTPSILGGTFGQDAFITIANATLNGCTNLGHLFMPSNTGVLTILGNGLINNGSLGVTNLVFGASAAITGQGIWGTDGGTISANGFTITNGAAQLLSGHGDIVAASLINNGLIEAEGGSLRLFLSNSGSQNNGTMEAYGQAGPAVLSFQQGTIDQSGGGTLSAIGYFNVPAGSPGTIQIGGAQTVTVIGGTLSTTSGGTFAPGIIQGVAAILAGDIRTFARFEIPANNFTVVTASTLANYRTMTLNAATSLLRFDASTQISGFGSITLTNNAILEINNNVVNNVTNGSIHGIGDNGTIQIDKGSTLTNNGTIAPGTSAGTLNFSGDLELSYSSNLAFDIGGTNQGTNFDLLHKIDSGTLTLNGRLSLTLINGFTPAASDTFTILTTQSPLAGAFSNVPSGSRLNTSNGAGSFVVTYNGNNWSCRTSGRRSPPPSC